MIKRKSSFFSKITIILLLINIPIISGMMIFFSQSISSLRTNSVEAVQLNQIELMKLIESDIDYAKQQLFKISTMSDWNELSKNGDTKLSYDAIVSVVRFRERFQNIMDTSRVFSDISANIRSANKRFSVTDGLSAFRADEFNEIRSFYLDHKRVVEWDGRMFVASQSGYLADASVNVAAEIDMGKIEQMMQSGKKFPHEEMVFVFHGNKDIYAYDKQSETANRMIQSNFDLKNMDGILSRKPLLIHTTSELGDFSIYSLVPANDVYAFLERFYASMIVVLLGTVVAIVAYFLVMERLIKKPIQELIHGFRQVETGDFTIRLERKKNDEISNLYTNFNIMSAKLNDLIKENYIKEIYAQRAIYRQLQSQINPHFLYNSFFVLQHMIKDGDNESAEEFSSELSQYYKFLTKTSRDDVLLEEELLHTKVYMNIMKKRYGRRLSIRVNCENEYLLLAQVPRLILQPFVENIFMHGLGSKREGLEICLNIEKVNDDIVIHISDNGNGMDELVLTQLKKELLLPDAETDSAIFNINKRIKIKFGEDYGVAITNMVNGGCRVELRFPSVEQADV